MSELARRLMEEGIITEKQLNEMEMRGNRTYWKGLTGPNLDLSKNAEKMTKYPCLFFTSHFGYALSYVLGHDKLPVLKNYPHLTSWIDATSFDLSQDYSNKILGYVHPLVMSPADITSKERINIFDSHDARDVQRLVTMIMTDSELGDHFVKHKINALKFASDLAFSDWFETEDRSSDLYLHGVKRDEFIEFMHRNTDGAVFHGIANHEYGKFSFIGVFKEKVPEWLKQTKPYSLKFLKGVRFAEKNKETGRLENIVRDVVKIDRP